MSKAAPRGVLLEMIRSASGQESSGGIMLFAKAKREQEKEGCDDRRVCRQDLC